MLSDRSIRRLLSKTDGQLAIKSSLAIQDSQFQPASFDLRLGDVARARATHGETQWWIEPFTFYLASTAETVTLGECLAGRVEGKSSWARQGLIVHCAGFVDPGFSGEITLELFNLTRSPIAIMAGQRVAQICFDWMDDRPDRVYGAPGLRSRYMGQKGPTPARGFDG